MKAGLSCVSATADVHASTQRTHLKANHTYPLRLVGMDTINKQMLAKLTLLHAVLVLQYYCGTFGLSYVANAI